MHIDVGTWGLPGGSPDDAEVDIATLKINGYIVTSGINFLFMIVFTPH